MAKQKRLKKLKKNKQQIAEMIGLNVWKVTGDNWTERIDKSKDIWGNKLKP